MTNREIALVGAFLVAICLVIALVSATGMERCQQLIKQAKHANQQAIADWIKGSEACN